MYYYLMANSSTLRFTVFSTYTMYKHKEMISRLGIENWDIRNIWSYVNILSLESYIDNLQEYISIYLFITKKLFLLNRFTGLDLDVSCELCAYYTFGMVKSRNWYPFTTVISFLIKSFSHFCTILLLANYAMQVSYHLQK